MAAGIGQTIGERGCPGLVRASRFRPEVQETRRFESRGIENAAKSRLFAGGVCFSMLLIGPVVDTFSRFPRRF
jgi:hypothetical protein